jgi:hypothetical protein
MHKEKINKELSDLRAKYLPEAINYIKRFDNENKEYWESIKKGDKLRPWYHTPKPSIDLEITISLAVIFICI